MVLGALPGAVHAQSSAHGQTLFESRCVACHSLDSNRVGPALRTVYGRTAGKAAGYMYSNAMAKAQHRWDSHSLNAWLTNPENVVAGQEMNYQVDDPVDRADLVAYLKSVAP